MQHGPQGNTPAEKRQVLKVADDPVFIIGRPGKRKADSRCFVGQLALNKLETLDYSPQDVFQGIRFGGKCYRFHDLLYGLHRREHQVCTPGVQCHYDSLVGLVIHIPCLFNVLTASSPLYSYQLPPAHPAVKHSSSRLQRSF